MTRVYPIAPWVFDGSTANVLCGRSRREPCYPLACHAPVPMAKTARTRTVPADAKPAVSASEPRPFTLAGRVALVTGSTRGLGKAIALALGTAGARVAFNYAHGRETAEATFGDFTARGFEGVLVRADVTDPAQVERLCAEVAQQLGPIDAVVANATPAQPQKPIEQYDWAFHQQMLDFVVKSPFLLARTVLPSTQDER